MQFTKACPRHGTCLRSCRCDRMHHIIARSQPGAAAHDAHARVHGQRKHCAEHMRQVHRMCIVLTRLMRRAQLVVIARVAVLNRDENPRPRPRPRPGPRPALLRGTTIARRFRCGSRSRHCDVLGKHLHSVDFDVETDARARGVSRIERTAACPRLHALFRA